MTSINGANHHHTVEDLLSSIRTSISDDHVGMRPGPSSPLNGNPRPDMAATHDPSEFELPAIFKPGHAAQAHEKSNKLFGRLSDALKPTAAAEPERPRTVIRFEPAGGRMIEPPAAPMSAHAGPPEKPDVAASKVEAENNTVGRHMPSFFDTRLNRLGEMTRQVNAPKPVEPPPPQQQPVQQPPPLRPQHPVAADSAGAGGLEDAAAQLLRPILKQWLTENMPKIVEKALRSEAGDDFPPIGTPPDRRK